MLETEFLGHYKTTQKNSNQSIRVFYIFPFSGLFSSYTTFTLLPIDGTSSYAEIHFFIVYVLLSTTYSTLIMWGKIAPSKLCLRKAFVFIFNHHCFLTSTMIPVVSCITLFVYKSYCCTICDYFCSSLHYSRRCITNIYNCICS